MKKIFSSVIASLFIAGIALQAEGPVKKEKVEAKVKEKSEIQQRAKPARNVIKAQPLKSLKEMAN